jgi:hypothetical protein
MRTVSRGHGVFALAAADGPAATNETLRRPAVPPRSPSSPLTKIEPLVPGVDEADESLIADARAGVSPAEMVELKLRALLRTRGVSMDLAGRARSPRGR